MVSEEEGIKDLVLHQLCTQAESMQQPLDEHCLGTIAQLNDDQMVKLHLEFQDRLTRAGENPIRNISALLLSVARGMVSGRISVGGQDTGAKPALIAPRQYLAVSRHGKGQGKGARAVMEEYGIHGVDDQAMAKIDELAPEDQLELISEFQQANSVDRIVNPSKWLFSHARSCLCQQAKSRRAVMMDHHQTGEEGHQLEELPGVVLDTQCIDKLSELEPDEHSILIANFIAESQHTEIRNPSGWLYAKARTAIVERITGVKGGSRPSGIKLPSMNLGHDPLAALADLGVDEQAILKLKELGANDLRQLLTQFHQLNNAGEVNEPSKWLFAKARTIAASRSQQQVAFRQQQGFVPPGKGGERQAQASRYPQAGIVRPTSGHGNVPELKGVQLDPDALGKLEELEADERAQLFVEYALASARRPIQNPSGWVFGRARTKVMDRITGRTRTQRSAPY